MLNMNNPFSDNLWLSLLEQPAFFAQDNFYPYISNHINEIRNNLNQERYNSRLRGEAWRYVDPEPLLRLLYNYSSLFKGNLNLNDDRKQEIFNENTVPYSLSLSSSTYNTWSYSSNYFSYDDSFFNEDLSKKIMPENAIFCSLQEARRDYPELLAHYMLDQPKDLDDRQQALWWWNDYAQLNGIFIYLPENCSLPFNLAYNHILSSNSQIDSLRNIIVLNKNSSLNYLSASYEASPQSKEVINSFSNNAQLEFNEIRPFLHVVNQIFLGKGAKLNYVNLQCQNIDSYHLAQTEIKQEQDSVFLGHNFNIGGKWSRQDLYCNLERNSKFSVSGLDLTGKGQKSHNYLRVNHNDFNAYSNQTYRGIVNQGETSFHSHVHVKENAGKASAHQNYRALLLHKDSWAYARPELEIFTPEVECSHGATVGHLREEEIFYLKTRGLQEKQAMALCLSGFIGEVLNEYSPNMGLEEMRSICHEFSNKLINIL